MACFSSSYFKASAMQYKDGSCKFNFDVFFGAITRKFKSPIQKTKSNLHVKLKLKHKTQYKHCFNKYSNNKKKQILIAIEMQRQLQRN